MLPGSLAAAPPDRPGQFEFARTKIGAFEATAETTIDWHGDAPFVQDVNCFADNQDIRFIVGRTGEIKSLGFAFRGSPEPDGDRPEITLTGDALWLFVDGKRYEHRNISAGERFTNYAYAPPPKDTVILPVWRGYRGIRTSETNAFVNMSLIYGDILRARKLEWAFKSRNWDQVDRSVPENALPKGWEGRRYPIDNKGLKATVEWCAAAVASDASRRLPPQILEAAK